MQKTNKQKEEDERLAVIISDRIHQLIEAFPEHFRPGRGWIEDFTAKYDLTRSVARRVLEGRGLPPPRLLWRIAEDLGVTVDWLYGFSDESIHSMREGRGGRIAVWLPGKGTGTHSTTITVPLHLIPNGLAARGLVAVPWPDHSCQPYVGPGDVVLVQPRSDSFAGAYHLIAWHHGRLDAARVAAYESTDRLMLQVVGGRAETLNASDVVFGLPDTNGTTDGEATNEQARPEDEPKRPDAPPPPKTPIVRVVGMIVGRLCFNQAGLLAIEPPR